MLANLLRRSSSCLALSCSSSGPQAPPLGVLLNRVIQHSCSSYNSPGQQAGSARGFFGDTDVSPTLKQQQLFSDMRSVRRMLLGQNPKMWHTEPLFWPHGAHLLPSPHRLFKMRARNGPSNTKLASIIEAQASRTVPEPFLQQLTPQERPSQQQRGRRARAKESSARHLEQLWQAAAAKGMSAGVQEWAPEPGQGGLVPMEMKNLIKVWRRLKMKKHKIRKRRKANRYKND